MREAIEVAAAPLRASLASQAQILRDLVLYGASSAAALAVDWTVLTLLVWHGVPAAAAVAIGFSLGMIVTYAASVGVIYADRRRGSKLRELTLFALIGLAGLGLNELLICVLGSLLGLPAPIAKAPTAGLVFLFNFVMRRTMLFASAGAVKPGTVKPSAA